MHYQGTKSLLSIQEHFSCHAQSFSQFLMPEKSSSPWQETFYIPQRRKSLPVPRMRHFTFLHARNVRPLERDRALFQGPEFPACENVKGLTLGIERLFGMWECKSFPPGTERLFRHGRDKKSNSKDIMLQYYDDSNSISNNSRNTSNSSARALTRKEHGRQ